MAELVNQEMEHKYMFKEYREFCLSLKVTDNSKILVFKYWKLYILRNTDYIEYEYDKNNHKHRFVKRYGE